jgi:ketosteroid isomerase-like protein
MRQLLLSAIVALMLPLGSHAQTAPDAAELTSLLKEFLAGASRNDASVHNRFWADDVIYTGSNGRRRGKADIMRDVRSAPAPKPSDPTTAYSAEDIRIQQYGDTAIVAFRLVGSTTQGGKTDVSNYLNTGTLRKRNGKWQVVSWQATKMPGPEADAKTQNQAKVPTATQKEAVVTKHASGAFEVKMNPQVDDQGEPTVGRMSLDKQFHGDLEAASKGQMLAVMTEVSGSAGYVAMERVNGKLHGLNGTFALQHSGTMTRGTPQLIITVVPDSGTGALAGLAGTMTINIIDGKHFYEFDYTLGKPD